MRFNTPLLMGLALLTPLALAAPLPAPITDKTKEHINKCAATTLRYGAYACSAAALYTGSRPASLAATGLGLASIPFAVQEHRLNGQAIPEIAHGGYPAAIKACVGDACKAVGGALGMGGRPPAHDLEMGTDHSSSGSSTSTDGRNSASFTTAHSHVDRSEKSERAEKAARSLGVRDELVPLLGGEAATDVE